MSSLEVPLQTPNSASVSGENGKSLAMHVWLAYITRRRYLCDLHYRGPQARGSVYLGKSDVTDLYHGNICSNRNVSVSSFREANRIKWKKNLICFYETY